MNVEKRLKELGLRSYGSQAISLTVEYGWICRDFNDPNTAEYRPKINIFLWLENGTSINCEGSSIEKVLDKAEEKLNRYKEDKELCGLRQKLSKIHQLSSCPA